MENKLGKALKSTTNDATEQESNNTQDDETIDNTHGESGESGGKGAAKEEVEDEGKTRAARWVPEKYNRDIKYQEVLKVRKPTTKTRGRPKQYDITKQIPIDEEPPEETWMRKEKVKREDKSSIVDDQRDIKREDNIFNLSPVQ